MGQVTIQNTCDEGFAGNVNKYKQVTVPVVVVKSLVESDLLRNQRKQSKKGETSDKMCESNILKRRYQIFRRFFKGDYCFILTLRLFWDVKDRMTGD